MNNTPIIYVIFGSVSSGKTTLALALSKYLGNIPHLDSDYIRQELTGSPNGRSNQVFTEMRIRLNEYLINGKHVILSSTGMSQKFINMINEYTTEYLTIKIKLNCDENAWKNREQLRNDRWNINQQTKEIIPFIMPYRAYTESSNVKLSPHVTIDTTNLSPEEVFNKAKKIIHDFNLSLFDNAL